MNTIERIYPDMKKVFGDFETSGKKVVHKSWNNQLRRQQADVIEIATYISNKEYVNDSVRILLPGVASSLNFEDGTPVIPVESYLTVKPMRYSSSSNRAYPEFYLHADTLFAEGEKHKVADYVPSGKTVQAIASAAFGIVGDFPIDALKQFGVLLFDGIKREAQQLDEDGNPIGIKHRTYNLKSSAQGEMIQVIVPVEVPEIQLAYNTPVEVLNPRCNVIANVVGNELSYNVNFRVDNIVQLGKANKPFSGQGGANGDNKQPENKDEKKPA